MSTPPLNFHRAVYEGDAPTPDQCAYCGRGITSEYYRVGGHMACPVCAQQAQSLVPPNEHKVFLHALSYGAVAAVLGCAAYALIIIVTGWTIGYAAIGVGFIIGWAMRKAAKEHGGKRYQWAAAILTYAAVAVAFVPIQIHLANEDSRTTAQQTETKNYPQNDASRANPFPGEPTTQPKPAPGAGQFFLGIAELLGLGLVSPFLELTGSTFGGLLNLFIIFIGVRFAWQMMAVRTVSVEGPFEATASEALPSSGLPRL